MNNAIHHSKHPESNIAAQAQPQPAHCDQSPEAITHEMGAALKRCLKCGGMEAA